MSLDQNHAANSTDAIVGPARRTRVDPTSVLCLAAAILVHDGRVLIVRRSETERFLPSVWGVPCGKVDAGEDEREAAVRELREETGLAGRVVRYVGKSVFNSVWRGRLVRNVQSNFLVHPLGALGHIKLPKADQAAVWLAKGEIEDFDGLDSYNLGVLRQWLQVDDSCSANETHQVGASSAAIALSRSR